MCTQNHSTTFQIRCSKWSGRWCCTQDSTRMPALPPDELVFHLGGITSCTTSVYLCASVCACVCAHVQIAGIWPEQALMNHSCVPSTISYASRYGTTVVCTGLRSYLHLITSLVERQVEWLQAHYTNCLFTRTTVSLG